MTRMELARVWPPNRDAASRAGHQPAEVKLCEMVTCPLWPFRAGRHPYTRRGLLEANSEQRPSPGTLMAQDRSSLGIGLQEADFWEGEANKAGATAIASAVEAV